MSLTCMRCYTQRWRPDAEWNRIVEHNALCPLHPESHESPQERAQRPWYEESDSEAMGRLWRALAAGDEA